MFKYISFIIIFCAFSCSSSEKEIIVNNDLIEPFYRNTYLDQSNNKIEFNKIESHIIDLNGNNLYDTISLYKIAGWEDTGKFNQIEITLDNNNKIIETNYDGWVKIGENYELNESIVNSNQIKSNLLLITNINSSTKFIFAFGWIYSSQPGLLTIFEANGQFPQLIFNNYFELIRIENNSLIGKCNKNEDNCSINLMNNQLTMKKMLNE